MIANTQDLDSPNNDDIGFEIPRSDGVLQREKAAQLNGAIAEFESELRTKQRHAKWYQLAVVAFLCATGFVIWKSMSWWVIIGIAIITLFSVALLGTHIDEISKLEGKVERHKAEMEIFRELPLSDATDSSSYFQNLVTINVTNLRDYYFLVKQHTNGSFRAAIGVGIVGFLLIISGLAIGFLKSESNSVTYIASGAGVLTEFISGVFFFLYNKTVRQLKEYHDSLLNVQNVLLSLKLLESVNDPQLRAPMITTMLEYLMRAQARIPIPSVNDKSIAARPEAVIKGKP